MTALIIVGLGLLVVAFACWFEIKHPEIKHPELSPLPMNEMLYKEVMSDINILNRWQESNAFKSFDSNDYNDLRLKFIMRLQGSEQALASQTDQSKFVRTLPLREQI